MNIVFKPPVVSVKKDKGKVFDFLFFIFILVIIFIVALRIFIFSHILDSKVSKEVSEQVQSIIQEVSVIRLVADSYGIPSNYMEKLSEYLSANKLRFGGIGLFSVRQEDINWIQDRVLLETDIDLTNDMQNTQVAAYLLKRFHDQGYSWKESFLIYTFGFSAIHDSNHEDFVSFIGFN